MNPNPESQWKPEQPTLSPEQTDLIQNFRTYLHVVITAAQTGQSAKLEQLAGPTLAGYSLALAKLPDNALAREISRPAVAMVKAIEEATIQFFAPIHHNLEMDPARKEELERVVDELDQALAFILQQVLFLARFRAKVGKNRDLMAHVSRTLEASDAAEMVWGEREQFPEEFKLKNGETMPGNPADAFAWDVYQRVAALERMADAFPELMRPSARNMHAWPMLCHPHTGSRERFERMAEKLELGREYPLDTGKKARHRPNTPMVVYLDGLVFNLHRVWNLTRAEKFASLQEENKRLEDLWWNFPEAKPGEKILAVLRELRKLPPLTKATSGQWARQVIVPLILEKDALNRKECDELALDQIARQQDVKSRATFKSRLLASVTKTLKSLARAGK